MERQRDRLAQLPSSKARSATVAKSNFLGSKPRSATVEKADSLSSKSKIATVANPRALGSKSMSATVVVLVGIARIESLALDWASRLPWGPMEGRVLPLWLAEEGRVCYNIR